MRKISTTIKGKYITQILSGTKDVEYKKATDFWNKRLEKLKDKENVIISFLCGRESYKFKVKEIIGIINSEKIIDDENVNSYWEIHLGDRIMVKKITWDKLYMSLVYLIAMKSKDKSTHIGAVIVGVDNEIRSTGYNGFVRNLNDDIPERQIAPEKYYWFEHAERNALYNATLLGTSLKNCRMYTNGIPCCDCTRGIIQSGIKEVIVDKIWNDNNKDVWKEHGIRALQMFKETGVKVRYYEGKTLEIEKFRRGEVLGKNR